MTGTAETAAEILAWLYAEAKRHTDQQNQDQQHASDHDEGRSYCTVTR